MTHRTFIAAIIALTVVVSAAAAADDTSINTQDMTEISQQSVGWSF